jgi:hypothetical protein
MTAYRQEALRVAGALAGGSATVAEVRTRAAAPNAGRILARDPYGWFDRVERGTYRLRDDAQEMLAASADPGPISPSR